MGTIRHVLQEVLLRIYIRFTGRFEQSPNCIYAILRLIYYDSNLFTITINYNYYYHDSNPHLSSELTHRTFQQMPYVVMIEQ